MKVIAYNGFKRSGKGEAALATERLIMGAKVKSVGFADKLKILAAKTLGFTSLSDAECIALMDEAKECWLIEILKAHDMGFSPYDPPGLVHSHYKLSGLTGRQYLQNLGNEARGVFGDDFWVDQVLLNPANIDERDWSQNNDVTEYVAEQYPGVDVLCITDERYPNEAQRVRAVGGVTVELVRPGTASDGHASEIPLPRDLVDYQIINDGTLADLEHKVAGLLKEIL